jgi:hypothetical protein
MKKTTSSSQSILLLHLIFTLRTSSYRMRVSFDQFGSFYANIEVLAILRSSSFQPPLPSSTIKNNLGNPNQSRSLNTCGANYNKVMSHQIVAITAFPVSTTPSAAAHKRSSSDNLVHGFSVLSSRQRYGIPF